MSKTDTMLFVTGTDDNYIEGALVLIASVHFHNKTARFCLMGLNLSPASTARVEKLASDFSIPIDILHIDQKKMDGLSVKRRDLTRAVYLRLLIPDLLPQEDKVIYMDSDMVVVNSLQAIWNVDLGNQLAAAVACSSPVPEELAETGRQKGTYINSGLMVLNLQAWRSEGISQKCFDLLADKGGELLTEDQSALNIICGDRILYLPRGYNVYSNGSVDEDTWDDPNAIFVIHYIISSKPWRRRVELGEIWHLHARAAGIKIRPIDTLEGTLSIFNRNRKALLSAVLPGDKHRKRRKVASGMKRFSLHYRKEMAERLDRH